MMFNGFLVYGDSDTSASDVTKSSTEPVSLGSSSDSSRARHHEDQLSATKLILKNKEETLRVQAESLALAEARIAELSRRLGELSTGDRIDRKGAARTRDCSVSCCTSGVDDETNPNLQEEVSALRDNLDTVQQLYRDNFYEMARQSETMEALRRANTQLRARERRQATRYRELSAEVERLKCDVSEVIGSNSDSGVWGAGSVRASGDTGSTSDRDSVNVNDKDSGTRGTGDCGNSAKRTGDSSAGEVTCSAGEVAGGLRHVAGQLRRLRDILACDCSCGLAEENKRLKLANESLEREARELRDRMKQLEESEQDKDKLRHKLLKLEGGTHDDTVTDTLSSQLQLLHGVLKEKSSRLQSAEGKTQRLRDRLKKMGAVVKENVLVHEELSQLLLQVERLRRAGELAGGRDQDDLDQTSFMDLRHEQPCTLAGPCARVQAGRYERETDRCERMRAGRQQRAASDEPCTQCGSDCVYAPPVPPRRSTKKKPPCRDQDCCCDADCRCCRSGTCPDLRRRPPSRHGGHSASDTLERMAATREVMDSARLRWRRRAPSHF